MSPASITCPAVAKHLIALIPAAFAVSWFAGCERAPSAPEGTPTNLTKLAARPSSEVQRDSRPMSGKDLYSLHCSDCHGTNGDGMGMAARYLHPKPRNFRAGGFRLVSRTNLIPTSEDLEAVLERGMPGSSMRHFNDLDDSELKKLASEVMEIRREGARERGLRFLREEAGEEDIDEGEIDDALDAQIRSGHALDIPRFALAEPADIAGGKEVFLRQGCPKCHGPDGEGDGDVYLIDDQGHPIRPRHLVYGPFKGGHEPESIYVRIRLGMPGSPMPANVNLGEKELIGLVHYCRSLSREPKRHLTNYQRAMQAIATLTK